MKKQVKKSKTLFPVLSFFVLFLAAFFLLQTKPPKTPEPLADPAVLSKLINHEPISVPTDEHYAEFHGTPVTPPSLASLVSVSRVLGTASPDEKHIEVDLSHQRLYAFEGSRKIMDVPVSTGKWGPTPTGVFHIWVKLKSTLMSGGEGADYYYLPNVPYVMFFSNNQVAASRGFSLHGTYWHNNFGHPMSHGCVNMRTEDAHALFDWASPTVTDGKAWGTYASNNNPGTEIDIYGTPPAE